MSEKQEYISIDLIQSRLGKKLMRIRNILMKKHVWNYDDFLFAINFLGDMKLKEQAEDTVFFNGKPQPNRISYLVDISYKDSEVALIPYMSISEISEWLMAPENTALLKSYFVIGFSKLLEKSSISPLQASALSTTSYDEEFLQYDDLSYNFWTKWMTGGNHAFVFGLLGSGKTDFSLNLSEFARISRNKRIATNIKISDPELQKYYSYWSTFGEMLLICVKNALEGFETLVVVDELVNANIRKKKTVAKKSSSLEQFAKGTRKLGIDVIYIYHDENQPLKELNDTVSLIISKSGSTIEPEKRREAMVTRIAEDRSSQTVIVKGITATNIPYQTRAFAFIGHDIDWDVIMDYAARRDNPSKTYIDTFKDLSEIIEREVRKHKPSDYEEIEKPPEVGLTRAECAKQYSRSIPLITNWIGDKKLVKIGVKGKLETFIPAKGFNPFTGKWEEKLDDQ